jgi:MSHA pilin protein MshC
MIELVVVMVIIGVLAAVAAPRLFGGADFNPVGFRDGVAALLRFGQKAAIAQRRNVCVAFAANSVTLTTAATPGNGVACTVPLVGPDGRSPASVTAAGNVTFAAVPAGFTFRALGDTSLAALLTITVNGATFPVNVAPTTGYVY